MKAMKKIGLFILICLSVLGLLGGIGLSAFNHQWQLAIGIAVLGYAAFPRVRAWAKELMNDE